MEEKNVLIFGDSYSTYTDCIPKGYATYYPRNDVQDVSATWWKLLAASENFNVILNDSWSGSTVCNTGYGGDCSKTSSFIHRLLTLIEDGFFDKNKIDYVFVFGGTNDSWTGNDAGKNKFDEWTDEDLHLVLPGYCYFIHNLLKVVSKDKIHIVINTGLRPEIEIGILDVCAHYSLGYTQLKEIDKVKGHPTAEGMVEIKNQILRNMK